ncbi:hypothetical protein [Mycolicibacterium goodii]|uniref:hypothetical protein n=1 Tax=Mycolicibacterium goodii TaxID=134601 RepID=UPI00256F1E95|nr:hypothetical protein [Mycolicibacterium goodii]
MGKATTKSGNLHRALEARHRANAEREARERAIVQSLKEFLDELDKLEHTEQAAAKDEEAALARAAERIARIERELNERLERIRRSAEEKATAIRLAAGAAAKVLRANGETIAGIAAQSGQTQARVRELLRLAESEQHEAGGQAPRAEHEDVTVADGGVDTAAPGGDAAQQSGDTAVVDPATTALSA